MAGLRFTLDLYIPEDSDGTEVAGVKIPSVLAENLPTIRSAIRQLKGFARRINEGKDNEEMTIRAAYHICRHEDGLPCEPEQEI